MRLNGPGLRSGISLLSLALILSGCATTTGSGGISPPAFSASGGTSPITAIGKSDRRPFLYCAATDPIRWSEDDTAGTIEQVKRLNAKWTALCGADRDTAKHAS